MSDPAPAARDGRARVSVCMATWNGERYLRAQVDSILAQLDEGDELVVSDDGSTDGTPALLAAYGDRLRVAGRTRAGGVVPNFERALVAARGDYIVLADQDDVWLQGRLDVVRERLRDVTLLMMNGKVVDADLDPTGEDVLGMVRFGPGLLATLARNRYVGCCMAFRRELLEAALPFPPRILWHDWYIALLGQALFTTGHDDRATFLFRRHDANASSTGERSGRRLAEKLASRFWMVRAVLVAMRRAARRHGQGAR